MHKRFVNRFAKQLMSDAFSQIYAKIGRVSAVWYKWVELGWIIIRIQHVLQCLYIDFGAVRIFRGIFVAVFQILDKF